MGIGNYFMNTNVDLFHDSTNNSNGILTSESNEMDLNTLIPVVDNNNHKVVDARLLHAFLQIRRDFTSWIKDRISKYGFIENQDFVLIKYDYLGNLLNDRLPHFGESDTQVVAKTDYLLLMDMAKERRNSPYMAHYGRNLILQAAPCHSCISRLLVSSCLFY